ncbi:hypothetical protein Tco_0857711 [Tanacetum coccineum]|uniref:Uncharacterized protein n=1 Tax=Tanacetum coccineum TaxID=301880 RepID=A0ABQ5B8X3_9ASTR
MEGEGMRVPEWMLTEEMKLTRHYQLTPSAHRPSNPVATQGESSTPRKPTVIRFHVINHPDPKTPILTAAEIDIDSLDEATRLSIAITRSPEDLEAQLNVEKVQEHLVDEEIEKINQEDPGTKLEPMSHQERPEEEKSVDVLIINDDEDK